MLYIPKTNATRTVILYWRRASTCALEAQNGVVFSRNDSTESPLRARAAGMVGVAHWARLA